MEYLRIEKLQTLKMYRRKKHYINSSLSQFFHTTVLLGLLLSSPLWLPDHLLCYLNINIFFFFPNIIVSLLFDHRCLFLVCNIIIMVLASDMKFSKSSTKSSNIYEEYVERSKSLIQEVSSSCAAGKKGKRSHFPTPLGEEENYLEEHGEEVCIRNLDELNKRVEDFISRVTKQRRLEERLIACLLVADEEQG